MKTAIYTILCILACLLVSLAGCTSQKDIVIGYIGPLSGPSAVLGGDAVTAIQMAVDEVNLAGGVDGQPVRLVVEDDQYLAAKTVTAYSKLVHEDGARVVLAATYGGVFAIADSALADGVIIIDPLDCNTELAGLNQNVFCLATETESIGTSLAEYAWSSNISSVGVLYSTKDNFMSLVEGAFSKRFEELGGQVMRESFAYTDEDFRGQLLKFSDQDVGGVVFLGHDETGLAMKQARELGMKQPFMATGTVTSPGLQASAQGAAEGTVFAYWEPGDGNQLALDFENRFRSKAGRGPILPLVAYPAYDSARVLLVALIGQMDVEDLRNRLHAVKDHPGVTGSVTIDSDGGARIPETVFRLQNGGPKKVAMAPISTA